MSHLNPDHASNGGADGRSNESDAVAAAARAFGEAEDAATQLLNELGALASARKDYAGTHSTLDEALRNFQERSVHAIRAVESIDLILRESVPELKTMMSDANRQAFDIVQALQQLRGALEREPIAIERLSELLSRSLADSARELQASARNEVRESVSASTDILRREYGAIASYVEKLTAHSKELVAAVHEMGRANDLASRRLVSLEALLQQQNSSASRTLSPVSMVLGIGSLLLAMGLWLAVSIASDRSMTDLSGALAQMCFAITVVLALTSLTAIILGFSCVHRGSDGEQLQGAVAVASGAVAATLATMGGLAIWPIG